MSMTSPQGEQRCEICGLEFPSVEEADEHLTKEHGGLSGREPGGTTGLEPNHGSGQAGATESGSRPQSGGGDDMVGETEGGGGPP
jgi:hypothetical protein